jgi:hypothetical protein
LSLARQSSFLLLWPEIEKNRKKKRVTLPDIQASTFEGYLQWLNTGIITFAEKPNMKELAEFYVLGDYLDDVTFRSALLDSFAERACDNDSFPTEKTIVVIWEQMPVNCPLRKLVLDIWVTRSIKSVVRRFADPTKDYPKAFITVCLEHFVKSFRLETPRLHGNERNKEIRRRRKEITEP